MIDAVSQIGILLLAAADRMETNLALVHRKRRAVISTSLFASRCVRLRGGLGYALAGRADPFDPRRGW